MFLTIVYFIIALVILITVHEYGHFVVARYCGVKVLRFSFGFGKVLGRWRDKHGTEFVWSLLPLGGYVKMLDESEEPVPNEEKHLAFNNKSVFARIAIVIAGPIFNFLFAFVALWLVLIIGIYSLAPVVETVKSGSPAAMAGMAANEEIIAFNEAPIKSWRDFQYALIPLIGSDETVTLTLKSLKTGQQKKVALPLATWELDAKNPDPLKSLGITPFIPTIPAVVGETVTDSPAQKAGLQAGDYIKQVNGKPLQDWLDLVKYVSDNPNKRLNLTVARGKQILQFSFMIGSQTKNGHTTGFIGVRSQKVDWPKQWLRYQHENPLQAIGTALTQTVELTKATFSLMIRFFTGKLAVQNVSGPVGIAQGAGESARSGFVYYLSFLALVSISLGALNLLPIPMLDGGHLLYYLIEIIRGQPLSDAAKSIGFCIGLVLLIALMGLGLSNDLARLLHK
ncbi:membrane associated zinc metalloprotease [Legionella beliardensis]|uniref:Zinc metalloprotease n=1 Tax=Legionella beliardensis TaxID=91822 RepID=A0A378HYT1_9GAMM|nr:RIP metalloprotease RseP [Legionella beliardensis]STX28059.1 membrane associated zinc metalloprotease [Legionella beliardensis]